MQSRDHTLALPVHDHLTSTSLMEGEKETGYACPVLSSEDEAELKSICQNGGGFDQRKIQLALKQFFQDTLEIYLPDYTELAGSHPVLPLDKLREQGYKFAAFSFDINASHQVAVCVTLTESKPLVSIYDSVSDSTIGEQKLKALQALLGGECRIQIEKSHYKPQQDNWSCGVHVIANIVAHYTGQLELNENKLLDVISLARKYYWLFTLLRENDEQKAMRAENNYLIKKLILERIKNKNPDENKSPHTDFCDNLADYLEQLVKGKMVCTDDKSKSELIVSTETERTKSIPDLLADYSQTYPSDETGLLILQIVFLHAQEDVEKLDTLLKQLLPLIAASLAKKEDHKDNFLIQLFATNLELKLNEELQPGKKKYANENDQHVFFNSLLTIIFSAPSLTEAFKQSLKEVDAEEYIGTDVLVLPDNEPVAICNGNKNNLDMLILEFLKIIVQRAMGANQSIIQEMRRIELEREARAAAQQAKLQRLKELLTAAGVSEIDETILINITQRPSACHFLETYLDSYFFSDCDQAFKIKVLTYFSEYEKNINWPFYTRPHAREIYKKYDYIDVAIKYSDEINDADTFYAVLDWLPKINRKDFINHLFTCKEEKVVLYWLACDEDNGVPFIDSNCLASLRNPDCLNAIIEEGQDEGVSLLYKLLSTKAGRALFKYNVFLIYAINEKGFNTIAQRGEQQGQSPIFWLASTKGGRRLLNQHSRLISMINESSLNAMTLDGDTAISWLTSRAKGRNLLRKNPELVAKINAQGLNAVDIYGDSAAAWLASTIGGRAILKKYPELVAKINDQFFNINFLEEKPASAWLLTTKTGLDLLHQYPLLVSMIKEDVLNWIGEDGNSSITWLTAYKQGILLLDKHPDLVAKISEQGLNASDKKLNDSAVIYLAKRKCGHALLDKHPQLVRMISEKSFNAIASTTFDKGFSAVSKLVSRETGRQLLAKHSELAAKINETGLNAMNEDGDSAVNSLLSSESGLDLLYMHPRLVKMISIDSLNAVHIYDRTSPITRLTASERGIEFLYKHPNNLLTKINAQGLNAHDIYNHSAVQSLAASEKGIKLLADHPELAGMISGETLNASSITDSRSAIAEFACKKSGRALLAKYPSLIAKISEKGMNRMDINGNYTAIWFASKKSGRELLLTHAELASKIDKQCLNTVQENGDFVLHALSRNKKGRLVLMKHPELVKLIKKKSLNAVYKGYSAAYKLLTTTSGRELLAAHPKLLKQIDEQTFRMLLKHKTKKNKIALDWLAADKQGRKLLALHTPFKRPASTTKYDPRLYQKESISTIKKKNASQHYSRKSTKL